MRTNAIYAVAVLAKLSTSTPVNAAVTQVERAQAATIARNVDLALTPLIGLNECKAQSCALADAAGSSGKPPTVLPEGANDEDYKCILKYNPSAEPLLEKAKTGELPKVPKQDTGASTDLFKYLNSWQRPAERRSGETDKGSFTGKCAPNILIFSKGTLEPTQYGVTVGVTLTKGWDSNWTVYPVAYNPTVSGDFCLGLPGGMVARDILNEAAAKCPTSKIFMTGYSQGAMVVRNGVAYANDSARALVRGVLAFGDPFQGSPIKGYDGPLVTYCKPDDGVCGGNFELSGAHLSYPFDDSVTKAKELLKKWAAET
ncbi:hypothetical protein E2P81_ATG00730 [Venturia nashicola]|uniref:cutinase n=1 Tax=Venturia nashicola TaxID=86259 RepID=A0A4Z1PJ54_9PEZI|nr:hypothetical protein E6O75_ATG00744 [Venturia nashicola]TLD39743.1 hypothetical protein E2P81_ATG00730 [Venturia nashicola]